MYRQILVDSADANFQLILWRERPTDALEIFRLKTVTYGTAAAPFLATRCLKALADEYAATYPLGATTLRRDFYMDDMLTGAMSVEEVCQIREEITAILRNGQFDIRKWCSNDDRVLAEISEEDRELLIEFDNNTRIKKALGIVWEPNKDVLQFRNLPRSSSSTITKRSVLSDMASIFDPLGLINPVVVLAKIFLQELWIQKLHWDESLPIKLHTYWQHFKNQLKLAQELSFPRFILTTSNASSIELHGFSDASQRAYGAVIYVRSLDIAGNICVQLLCAKSRVAPVRALSLPRLELCAALWLVELISRIRSSLHIPIDKIICWTDSTIVLDWLSLHASTWTPFVSHRVAKIQELSSGITWYHIDTKSNPADVVSRGMFPRELANSTLWFNGPSFLKTAEESWPKVKGSYKGYEDMPERRKPKIVSLPVLRNNEDMLLKMKFLNDFGKLRRTVAYILRFFHNALSSAKQRTSGPFSVEELNNAENRIIWIIQQREFAEDIRSLEHSSKISPKSCLRTLSPFLDDNSTFRLLRVGGRLQNADLTFNAKHPIILPKRHPFVLTLINYYHVKYFHAGLQALTGIIRQKYWVINARSVVRMVIFRCYRCFRAKPRLLEQVMGNLPASRVNPARPFVISGVDFCGPFLITLRQRGKPLQKAYVAVFICFVTKAVHLEVVSNLTADAFIAALKRFISRRGHCRTLYCDNGTNFVGARRELKELHQQFNSEQTKDHIVKFCAEDGIEFRHIPPRSPHFGGLW